MGEPFPQRIDAGIDNVGGRVEIRLADFEMNDVASLCFQGLRFYQNFECRFGAKSLHALGQAKVTRF